MGKENKFGMISHSTKVSGKTIKSMEEEDFSVQMEMFTKVASRMENSMVKESSLPQTDQLIQVNGSMTCKMGTESRRDQITLVMKDSMQKV